MRASNPKVIFDLYQWLPSYGETTVNFTATDLKLEVEIFYDSESDGEKSKKIVFTGVCSFLITSVPGLEIREVEYDCVDVSGALIEFESSEIAQLWSEHRSWTGNRVCHYLIFFLSVNKRLEVFAEECHLHI